MKNLSDETKRLLFIITFGMVLFVTALNIGAVFGFIGSVISAAVPVLAGLALAFVLNVPMRLLEEKAFCFMGKSKSGFVRGMRRPVALILTIVLALFLVAVIFAVLVPTLVKTVGDILINLNNYARRLPSWLTKLLSDWDLPSEVVSKYYFSRETILDTVIGYITERATDLLSRTASITFSIFSTVFNIFIMLIVAIYMLACKERVMRFTKRLLKNFTSEKIAGEVARVGHVAYNSFYGFIVGQFTDSFVLGALCYVGMLIFGFPYAGVISMVVGAAQLIPIIGGIISASVGTLLIFTQSPIQALLFLIFLIIIQQIEGNLIYPHIVGDKVGLPGLIVVSGVIFLGNFFGILGILLGIPMLSAIYALVRIAMDEKEKKAAAEQDADTGGGESE